jgi:hypothetical protein
MKTTKTPEEIAEGLSPDERSTLRKAWRSEVRGSKTDRFLTGPLFMRLRDLQRGVGRDHRAVFTLSDLGRAVADVLAKRGAR